MAEETTKSLEEITQQQKALEEFKNKIKGRVIILYGASWIGKSLFALNLSKLFTFTKLYLIDNNYTQEYFNINPKIDIVKIETPKQLDYSLTKETIAEDKLIIIDSITTLQTAFIRDEYFSARAYNEFNNFADRIARKLSNLTPKTTSIIIAHEKIKDWKTAEVIPRVNYTMLRNADMLIRIYRDGDKRKVKIVDYRHVPKKIEFEIE
jgi:hypothetical protein